MGQVFGHHLVRGGADLTFFVREKYREVTERGFDLYRLRLVGAPVLLRLEGFGVMSSATEVATRRFDQIYLALPSQALRGAWLPELVGAAPDATIVSIQPGPDDRQALLDAGVPPERLVSGMISLVSYPAPLPGETRFSRPGMAFFHPPVARTLFSGPPDRLGPVLSVLERGGFPVRRHPDVHREVSFFTAVLMPYLVALEKSGWSVRSLLEGKELELGAAAAREAAQVVAATEGSKTLPARLAGHAALVADSLSLATKVAPFPLEPYLQFHFTKTRAQTRFILEGLLGKAKALGMATPALQQLLSEER